MDFRRKFLLEGDGENNQFSVLEPEPRINNHWKWLNSLKEVIREFLRCVESDELEINYLCQNASGELRTGVATHSFK